MGRVELAPFKQQLKNDCRGGEGHRHGQDRSRNRWLTQEPCPEADRYTRGDDLNGPGRHQEVLQAGDTLAGKFQADGEEEQDDTDFGDFLDFADIF